MEILGGFSAVQKMAKGDRHDTGLEAFFAPSVTEWCCGHHPNNDVT